MSAGLVTAKNSLWQKGRHHVVRHIDDIGYAKIDGNAADDVGLLSAEAAIERKKRP